MNELFNRCVTATIVSESGTKVFQHDSSAGKFFNIEFESEFGSRNLSGKVKFWNITKSTVEALREKTSPAQITLNAGYGKDLGLILSGDVTGLKPGGDGADKFYEATATNTNMLFLIVNRTWEKMTVSAIVSDIAGLLGFIPDVKIEKDVMIPSFASKPNVIQTLRALAAIAVDTKNKPAKFSQEIRQGGKLQFYNDGMLTAETDVITLDGSSGLIGKPVLKSTNKTKKFWTAKSLLQHRIIHGAKIQINYSDMGTPSVINGTVTGGKHRGGTYSEEFVTEIDVSEP